MDTLTLLQHYWWLIISLLGALLVFLLFVQGGQGLLYDIGKTEEERNMLVNSLGRKWEFTFTTLVTFGGAFFASFPLFYSTSFGGAFYVWMAILLVFVIQAVAYEYRRKPGNVFGEKTFNVFLMINGIAGPLLAAMDFVDSLAKVGTIVGSVDAILNGAEQDHGETPAEFQGRDIQLSHVSFGYHADKEVLHDVSLTIPAGTMTAFVGPSGSGKSTIAKLIAGFWDVTSGSITLGGQDLKRVPLKQLYDQVAFVSQDNYLFDESIRENIRMGRPAATDAEVEAVAKAAGCDTFIRSLEHGYDTVVGGGGAHLSGGERQRIAIARSMLKDAPIVVLDEATAYIDPENEAVVQQAVGRLVAGKTVLVIAHRLSTITGADQIVVVNGGRIQDVGTHGELLKNCPLYQEMWRAHMGAKEGEQA